MRMMGARAEIECPLLTLRPISAEDGEDLAPLLSDPRVIDQTGRLPRQITALDFAYWAARDVYVREAGLGVRYAIDIDGKAVGTIGLGRLQADDPFFVGYWLGRSAWGAGLATQALLAIRNEASRVWPDANLLAYVLHDNAASCRVLEKCGFVRRKDLISDWSLARDGAPTRSAVYDYGHR